MKLVVVLVASKELSSIESKWRQIWSRLENASGNKNGKESAESTELVTEYFLVVVQVIF